MTKLLTPYENLDKIPAVSQQNGILGIIEKIAMASETIDVEKMQALLDMQMRIMEEQKQQAYSQAMVACQQQMPKIAKDKKNEQTRSMYATLESILDAITPVYASHGFALSFSEESSLLPEHIRIVLDVMHASGCTKRYYYDSPLDGIGIAGKINKTAPHARGSAITYGRRYLTMMVFNLSIGDDDDGNAAGGQLIQKISEEQVAELEALIQDVGADKKLFLQYLKCNSLTDIAAIKFKAAVEALEKKRGK